MFLWKAALEICNNIRRICTFFEQLLIRTPEIACEDTYTSKFQRIFSQNVSLLRAIVVSGFLSLEIYKNL